MENNTYQFNKHILEYCIIVPISYFKIAQSNVFHGYYFMLCFLQGDAGGKGIPGDKGDAGDKVSPVRVAM